MKSVIQITLCVGLLILIAYVTLGWAQHKPPQPRSVSISQGPQVAGLLPHGKVKDGLAAFLLCHHDCFKVGQAIPLSYGIVNIGSGLRRETNLQKAEDNAKFKKRIWWLQNEPADQYNYSWFEVTGLNGQNILCRASGGTLPRSAPLNELSVLLHHRQFVGSIFPDLGEVFELNTPGTYKIRWGYDADFEGGAWTGELMSNEVQFEIIQ